eukprot:346678-Rhodomonas_salina.1
MDARGKALFLAISRRDLETADQCIAEGVDSNAKHEVCPSQPVPVIMITGCPSQPVPVIILGLHRS